MEAKLWLAKGVNKFERVITSISAVLIFALIMQLHRGVQHLPSFRKAVLTIGTFDGVHLGHRKIIESVVTEARRLGGESILITFDPHPRQVLQPEASLHLINTLGERLELLQQTGLDHVVVVPFTINFAAMSASDYLQQFLINLFQPHTIVIGYDHHFGKNRQGNYAWLQQHAAEFGYQLKEIPKLSIDEAEISSTAIRKAIIHGDVEGANALLGYDYFFEGQVVHGEKLGRQLGYPTANLVYNDIHKLHLGDGVYAAMTRHNGKWYKSMLSIGHRPTLHHGGEAVEVYLFEFNKDIYGQKLRVSVKKFLRSQYKFNSLDALKQQMHLDRDATLSVL